MKKFASVTVIVPTYNSGRFIDETIESILRQTVMPQEIIIIDDGSKDHTEQVVREYMRYEPRIHYYYQQNAGVAAARNVALNVAQSDFVTFLDADDRWRPQFIQTLLEFLLANPSAVCGFGNFVRFDNISGKILGDQFKFYPELAVPLKDEPLSVAVRTVRKPWAFSSLVQMNDIPAFPVVMMYRRRLIAGLRFDPRLKICEDTHFALRAFMRGDVCYTSEVLCEVRRHNANITFNYQKIAVHKLKALKAIGAFVTGDDNIKAYHDRLIKAHMDAAIHQAKSGEIANGIRDYRESFRVPGSMRRKINGSVRMALAIPRGLVEK